MHEEDPPSTLAGGNVHISPKNAEMGTLECEDGMWTEAQPSAEIQADVGADPGPSTTPRDAPNSRPLLTFRGQVLLPRWELNLRLL